MVRMVLFLVVAMAMVAEMRVTRGADPASRPTIQPANQTGAKADRADTSGEAIDSAAKLVCRAVVYHFSKQREVSGVLGGNQGTSLADFSLVCRYENYPESHRSERARSRVR